MSKAISRKRDFSKITVNGQPLEVLSVLDIEVPVWRDPEKGEVWVFLKPVVEQLGLRWQPQQRKIRNEQLYEKGITLMVIPSAGGPQTSLFIRRKEFLAWLFRLQPTRVRDEWKDRLHQFQLEAVDALDRYFSEGVAVNPAAVAVSPETVARNFVQQTAEVQAKERIAVVREALAALRELEELTGQGADAYTTLIIREAIAGSVLLLEGGEQKETRAKGLWSVEDLREDFPGVPEREWLRFRSAIGRKLKGAGLSPVGTTHKLINGKLREVRVYSAADREEARRIASAYLQSKGLL